MATNGVDKGAGQVRIQLFTRQPDIELPEKPGPILVSTKLNRRALSTLVNELLSTPKDKPIPFEILINGTFLRTNISSYLDANGVSAETTLSVEYTRALLPPTHQSSFEHDDWVGSVDILSSTSPSSSWTTNGIQSGHSRMVTGGFDGLIRVWSPSGQICATSTLSSSVSPTQNIFSTKFLDSHTIVSSGFGVPVRIWEYEETESDGPDSTGVLRPKLDLFGHSSPSLSLAVHGPSQRILSASEDGSAALFSSNVNDDQPSVPDGFLPAVQRGGSNKRRKLSKSENTPQAGPLSVLSGHSSGCTGIIFHPKDSTAAYTTSRDRTLRTWDLVTSANVSTRTPQPGTQLTAVCGLPQLGLLAAGSVADRISLVDPRADATRSTVMTLVGFRNRISAVAASPESDYGLAGASHDGTVRVFDVRGGSESLDVTPGVDFTGRTVWQTYKIPRSMNEACDRVVGGEGVKVFDMCWDKEVGIVSVSEDKRAQINRAER